MSRTPHLKVIALAVLAVFTLPTLSACGPSSGDTAASGSPVITSSGQRTVYPVTVTDCDGRKTTYTKAPARVVTFDDNITETLLSLGLADRIVGATKFDVPGSEWAPTKAQMDALPMINKTGTLSSGYPSKETVVAQNPDLVASVYESAFDKAYGPGTHESWTALGVNSYQTLQDCETNKAQYDFSLLYQDIHNLGVIFDVQDRATALIQKLQGEVSELQARVKAAGLGSYRIGTHDGEQAHPGTMGITTANAIITQAGSTYAFLNDDTGAQPISWETFVARDPQVIWVITDLGQTATQTETQLENDPRTRNVDGVLHKRFVVVSYNDAVGSPRCIDGLRHMVHGLVSLKQQGVLS